ncbi:hypothetical protein [Paenibacillus periandrae]|uniref:hypothetical protein n=1 Tax=Paenibacillus periandrae TaxID=1761741 RepID=UPI001F089FB7|nr:hypothetical protein [Paenibacillus periandrae]
MISEKLEGLDNIVRALELWVELTNVDPNAKHMRIRDFDLQQANKNLTESLLLDPSKITTVMLLDYFVRDYLNQRTFTVQSILDDYSVLVDYLAKCKEILSILEDEEVIEAKETFRNSVIKALQHYGVTNQSVYSMANNYHELGFLRRDALRSMESLEVHQFSHGESDGDRPIYYDTVHEFWNINSLIKTMAQTKRSGISLNLIRDPFNMASFFVFALRNGGTLSILTDKKKEPHPIAKKMHRRPDRILGDRVSQNHFPYGLMNLEFSEDGREAYIIEEESFAVAPFQAHMLPMKKLADLMPKEIIWIAMMFSRIEQRFWKENFKTLGLSYTGEMIKLPESLIVTASHLPAVIDNYKVLEAPVLTKKDITYDAMKEDWGERTTQFHRWMEERYEHLIKDDYLNMLDDGLKIKVLSDDTKEQHEWIKIVGNNLIVTELAESKVLSVYESLLDDMPSWDREKIMYNSGRVYAMDATMFGSSEELISDQRWIARYNKAKIINQAAREEYDNRREEIYQWVKDRITLNAPALFEAIAKGELLESSFMKNSSNGEDELQDRNMLRLFSRAGDTRLRNRETSTYNTPIKIHNGRERRTEKYYCIVNDSVASLFAKFIPETLEGLALMCGCTIEELPDLLHYWQVRDASGNNISSRNDPMEWVAKNPWRDLKFDTILYLSKSGYNSLCKQHGTTPSRFWVVEENERKKRRSMHL